MPIEIKMIEPPAPIELKIVWEGEAPGVAEHRLSIGAFGSALHELLRAYRRIASNMMRSAAGYAEKGRLNELANLLDIEIESVEGNSVGITAVCTFDTPANMQAVLFPVNVLERASVELLDSIADESSGRLRNSAVRKYLSALPPNLTRQVYELHDNGKALHDPVIIGEVNLATPLLGNLSHLVEFVGVIVGVGFEPGTSEVRIRTDENESLRLLAPTELVELALEHRGAPVKGLAVKGRDTRLIRLTAADTRPFVLTDEIEEHYVFDQWDSLLARLAQ